MPPKLIQILKFDDVIKFWLFFKKFHLLLGRLLYGGKANVDVKAMKVFDSNL